MTFRIFSLCFALLLLVMPAQSQNDNLWDLQKCLDYAANNNLRLQQAGLNVRSAELSLNQAQDNRLPNANAFISARNSFGFSIDPVTDQFTTQGIFSLSPSLSSNVTIYNGFRLKNLIRQSEVDLLASQSDLDNNKNSLVLNIATAYLQVLSDYETLESARIQLTSTKEQRDRTAKLVRAGSLAQADLLQLESQIATQERTLVNAENSLDISYLNLRSIMNLPADEVFEVERPELAAPTETDLPGLQEIINYAQNTQPSVEAADLRIRSAQINQAIAQAGKLPSLSAGAGVGTGYTSGLVINGEPVSVADQFSRQFGGNIGLSLNVPIYNRGQNETNIQQAKIGIENAQLNADIVRQDLQVTIQQSYVDVENAYSSYQSIERQIEALDLTFKNTEKQFNLGLVNSVDYLIAQNNLNQARFDLVRTKYIYFFRRKVLDFYMGKPITF
ncbi:MAG: TolC family protein [Bacteroidota bacterium]